MALSMSQTGRRALPFSVCDNLLHILSVLSGVLSVFLLVYCLCHWEICLILSDFAGFSLTQFDSAGFCLNLPESVTLPE